MEKEKVVLIVFWGFLIYFFCSYEVDKNQNTQIFSTQNLGLTFFRLGLKGLPFLWDHLDTWTYATIQ